MTKYDLNTFQSPNLHQHESQVVPRSHPGPHPIKSSLQLIYAPLIGWFFSNQRGWKIFVMGSPTLGRLFPFKSFRETATCLLWRLWRHGGGRLLSALWLVEPWEYSNPALMDWPRAGSSSAGGTHFQSDITLCSRTHTAGGTEMRHRFFRGRHNRWKGVKITAHGCRRKTRGARDVDGAAASSMDLSAEVLKCASGNQWRDCFCRGNTPSEQESNQSAVANQR